MPPMTATMPIPSPLPPSTSAPANSPAPGAEISKSVATIETKVTDDAKNLVKSLESSTDAMTLEDLNSARQTVARIDAMIDVEKHLADLEKVHNERTGVKPSNSFSNTIPASALLPPPPATAPMTFKPIETSDHEVLPKPLPQPGIEISRIVGSEGRYAAVLRVSGELKTFRAGDQVSSKTSVRSISASSVVLDENGEVRTLRVKNVDAIYSAMR